MARTHPYTHAHARVSYLFFLQRDAYAARMHSAVYAMARCLSVRPSVTRQYCIEMSQWIQMVFGIEATLHCVVSEFRYLQKLHKTLSQTLNLTDFSTCSPRDVNRRKCCQLRSTVEGLSQRAATFVYNTSVRDIERRAVPLRQLSLLLVVKYVFVRLQLNA